MSRAVVIGVDGGNSKTDVVLAETDGRVLAAVRGPGSSAHHLGLEAAVTVVGNLIAAAWSAIPGAQRSNGRAAIAAMFMAGADLPHEEIALAEAVQSRGWARHNEVRNDVFAILWAENGHGYGVGVTVGAGVNSAGRAPSGRVARFPALGAITGDWGGGPDIGMAALGAAVRAEDCRGPQTALTRIVAEYFGHPTALDVAVAIHEGRLHPGRLIELPPLVVAAAEAGDEAAQEIIDRQVDEVVMLALAGLRQLEMTDVPADVVLGGSVLLATARSAIDRIQLGIRAEAPQAQVRLCSSPPVVGAALAGLHAVGAGPSAAQQLRDGMRNTAIAAVGL